MDTIAVRIVTAALALISCLCIGGIVMIRTAGQEPPEVLGILASSCVTGILGIIVPSGRKSEA